MQKILVVFINLQCQQDQNAATSWYGHRTTTI